MILAAQLLMTPTLEHFVDALASGCNTGTAGPVQRPLLIEGQNGLQTCLIQCIIESASESLPHHRR